MIKRLIYAGMLAIAMFVPSTAQTAETLIYDNLGNTVTLTRTTCTDKTVLKFIPENTIKNYQWFAGTVLWQGKNVSFCYTIVPRGGEAQVVIVDSDGEVVMLPLSLFRGPNSDPAAYDKFI